jgi:hypothetical protein
LGKILIDWYDNFEPTLIGVNSFGLGKGCSFYNSKCQPVLKNEYCYSNNTGCSLEGFSGG